jgi:hypothetical protein
VVSINHDCCDGRLQPDLLKAPGAVDVIMSILNPFRDSQKAIEEIITSSQSSCSAIDAESMCGGGGALSIGRGSSYNEVGARSSGPPHHQLFATTSPASPRKAMMSQNDDSNASARSIRRQPSSRSIFSVPTPIKQLFDQFPLITYPVNDFPQRAPQHHDAHVLYVFTTDEGAIRGAPSHNPACLKWQVSTFDLCPYPTTELTLS